LILHNKAASFCFILEGSLTEVGRVFIEKELYKNPRPPWYITFIDIQDIENREKKSCHPQPEDLKPNAKPTTPEVPKKERTIPTFMVPLLKRSLSINRTQTKRLVKLPDERPKIPLFWNYAVRADPVPRLTRVVVCLFLFFNSKRFPNGAGS
jgi:hypothetical protein